MSALDLISHPLTGTPFGTALDLCLILAALVWLASAVTRECSWADRPWSLCPPACCLIVAASLDCAAPRAYQRSTPMLAPWPRFGGAQ